MITRKDNLLVRPWQQRKFDNHRRKVQSALPAIDTSAPAYRSHVAIKLKKQQNENERCKKIEKDNFLLLQKMDYIMKTTRIDNCWKTPQPNFLNKIAIYNIEPSKIENVDDYLTEKSEVILKSRKSKCYACTLTKRKDTDDSEKRIPWEPSRRPISKIRSRSVPVKKSPPLPTITEQLISPKKPNSSKIFERTTISNEIKLDNKKKKLSAKEPQSIILSRGCLKLYVNFPSDTVVKFQRGNVEKLLMKEICHCKNLPTALQ